MYAHMRKGSYGGQKRVLCLLELKLHVVQRCPDVDAGNQNQILWMSITH